MDKTDAPSAADRGSGFSGRLGAVSEARCWWPSGHFWSQPDRWNLVECLWCAKRVPAAQRGGSDGQQRP